MEAWKKKKKTCPVCACFLGTPHYPQLVSPLPEKVCVVPAKCWRWRSARPCSLPFLLRTGTTWALRTEHIARSPFGSWMRRECHCKGRITEARFKLYSKGTQMLCITRITTTTDCPSSKQHEQYHWHQGCGRAPDAAKKMGPSYGAEICQPSGRLEVRRRDRHFATELFTPTNATMFYVSFEGKTILFEMTGERYKGRLSGTTADWQVCLPTKVCCQREGYSFKCRDAVIVRILIGSGYGGVRYHSVSLETVSLREN
ncbi:uncharacterized protein LOC121233459 [Aquila chrysaetos chrysaetos]|uniref:uncharacterized protein LOC121233459 n=1 Tax=Aquila chrysaetos chrysaetos TaxID=223781 RepID=UPI001B7D2EFD|nr:uncharacterized protein LOC121233459 [Aquila chrysaetos chrysaetos]